MISDAVRSRLKKPLTLCFFNALDIGSKLVDGFDIFIFLNTVENDSSTCLSVIEHKRYSRLTGLKIDDTILVRHCPDGYAGVQFVSVKVKSTDSSSVDASPFLLKTTNKLDRLDFWSARNSTSGEDGTESVESVHKCRTRKGDITHLD